MKKANDTRITFESGYGEDITTIVPAISDKEEEASKPG
jgi:hypothetical protein